MKKWFKKTVAVVLTAAMAMTVGTPVFAAETNDKVTKESLSQLAKKYNLEIKFSDDFTGDVTLATESLEQVENEIVKALQKTENEKDVIVCEESYLVDMPEAGIQPLDYTVADPVTIHKRSTPVTGLVLDHKICAQYGIYGGLEQTKSGCYWVKVFDKDVTQFSTNGQHELGEYVGNITSPISTDKSKITLHADIIIYDYIVIGIPGSVQVGQIKTGEQEYSSYTYFYANSDIDR